MVKSTIELAEEWGTTATQEDLDSYSRAWKRMPYDALSPADKTHIRIFANKDKLVIAGKGCDRCRKMGVNVRRTPDGDGPFCKDCYNYMANTYDY